MASAWGKSWGLSWGNAWGKVSEIITVIKKPLGIWETNKKIKDDDLFCVQTVLNMFTIVTGNPYDGEESVIRNPLSLRETIGKN
jgi:hypothetical protein